MYTFFHRLLSLALLLSAAVAAHSQNIDTNPSFDDGIAGWTPWGTVEWAPSFGFDTGSIHLDTKTSTSYATQCVWAEGGQTFVATTRVYSHCAGARFYVFWAAAADCSDTGEFTSHFAVSSKTDEWEELAVTAPAQDGAFMIQLMLFNGGGCSDGVYFDDVMLQSGRIFDDEFDLRGIG
jgi:hypothetical protein